MAKPLTHEEWLARRKSGIGGSDMAAILGISPWRTPLNVWLDKTGRAADQPPTLSQEIGNYLEPLAAKKYEEETGRRVRKCNVLLKGAEDGDVRIGNVDRLCFCEDGKLPWRKNLGVVTDRALEIKTTKMDEWDEVPDYYKAQALHYMGMMPTVKVFDFPVLFIARGTMRIYTVERDDSVIRDMADAAKAFWNDYVLKDTPPPATNESDFKTLWPRHVEGKTAVASEEVERAVREYRELADKIKGEEENLELWRLEIQKAMGDAESLVTPDGRKLATWKTNKPTEKIDFKAILLEVASRVHFDPMELAAIKNENSEIRYGTRVFRLSAGK